MNVEVIVPDGPSALPTAGGAPNEALFGGLVSAAGAQLDRAERAEGAFVAGRGGLQEMVVERARADIALQIATSAAQRATQALNAVLGMQI